MDKRPFNNETIKLFESITKTPESESISANIIDRPIASPSLQSKFKSPALLKVKNTIIQNKISSKNFLDLYSGKPKINNNVKSIVQEKMMNQKYYFQQEKKKYLI